MKPSAVVVHQRLLSATGSLPRTPAPGGVGARTLAVVFGALAMAFLSPASANAQTFTLSRFSLEPRVGMAFPTGDFGDVDPACPPGSSGCPFPLQVGTETGWRWAVRAHYAMSEHLSVGGEFGKANLGCSPTFCGTTEKPGTRGFSLGLRAIAFPLGSMDIWVDGAGVLEQPTVIRTLDRAGEIASSAVSYPWSPGFSAGFGAELDINGDGGFFFSPGFRFRYVPSDPPDSDPDLAPITATYMLLELGFRMVLGKG